VLHSAPWWTITDPKTNIDIKFNPYCEIIKIILEKHAPLTSLRVKTTNPVWMTKKYKLLLNKVNQLKTQTLRHNTPAAWLQFKKHRNKCENLKSKLKLESFNEHIQNNSNSKSAWRVFNNEIGKSTSQKPIQKLIVDERELTTETDVGDAFCKFFADISTTTREASLINEEKLPHPNNLMDNDEISNEEVLKAIKFLKTNKPVGSDGIIARFYKLYGEHITYILTNLFNASLSERSMPSVLKRTVIKCLYKGKGTKSKCTNYRPISIISSTSKLFEQIMYQRLSNHLENTNQLSEKKHGYRKARSTQCGCGALELHSKSRRRETGHWTSFC
jgi:hypothetical protein